MYNADKTYLCGVREAIKEFSNSMAKENFIEGLNENTKGYVGSSYPINSNAAIAKAIRHEQMTGASRATQLAHESQTQP